MMMKILTCNIKNDSDNIISLISSNADIIFLQDVPNDDFISTFVNILNMGYCYYYSNHPRKSGNAIISRYPMFDSFKYDFVHKTKQSYKHIIFSKIQDIWFGCTQLEQNPITRYRQCREIMSVCNKLDGKIIIGGDMNTEKCNILKIFNSRALEPFKNNDFKNVIKYRHFMLSCQNINNSNYLFSRPDMLFNPSIDYDSSLSCFILKT